MALSLKLDIPYHKQKNSYYCGPAALQMVFEYFGRRASQSAIARQAKTNSKIGTTNKNMIRVARQRGFSVCVKNDSTFFEISRFFKKGLPIIVKFIEPSVKVPHFAVVSGLASRHIILNDPWNGKNFKLSRSEFLKHWHDEDKADKKWLMALLVK